VARKPLSIGFEEIAADKIIRVELVHPSDEAVDAEADADADTAD
jgi:hypothetical protein